MSKYFYLYVIERHKSKQSFITVKLYRNYFSTKFQHSSVHNQELINAVERLKRARVVKRDKDIVEKTGYSKGLVSKYLSGKGLASKSFLQKFQEVYNISLSEPEPMQNNDSNAEPFNYQIPLTNGRVAVLSYPKNLTEQDIEILKSTIDIIELSLKNPPLNNN